METRRSNRIIQDSIRMHPLGMLALLFGVAGGCDSPTRTNPPAPSDLSGTFSLFAIDGYPTDLFCTAWVDPNVGAALGETDAYYFMYVNARLTFRPAAGEVDVKHRLVSCGGGPTETIEVELLGSVEQHESLILITYSDGAESYTDTARLRGDAVFVRALRIRRGLETRGTTVLAYRRVP